MTTQTSRSFLHSCLKVPIDPCNNCPAPIYNRPKMYLGRLTKTPLGATTRSRKTSELGNVDTTLANSDIRSLAKLYDSIPDYCDINHLPKEEFYSTLDTLRSTCCELRTKSAHTCVVEVGSTTSSSVSSHCRDAKSSKLSKLTKSRPSTAEGSGSKKKSAKSIRHEVCTKSFWRSGTPVVKSHKIDSKTKNRIKSYKEDFDEEIQALQNSLKDFEEELKQRHASLQRDAPKMIPPKMMPSTKTNANKNENNNTARNGDKPPMTKCSTSTFRLNGGPVRPSSKASNSSFRKFLKKSFSFNDINSIADSMADSKESEVGGAESKTRSETETLINRTPLKFSSYFAKTNFTSAKNDLPKIVVESPSSETTSAKSSSRSSGKRKKRTKDRKQNENFQVPFSIFNLGTKAKIEKPTPSPIHPVARPNLAATLRVEVSKRKLKELQNNCTYYDSTPQVDWEVRKTPAWKSLSLNESHKEILSMRLATRKAEQAMQQREYELNMELMRQRVKSAPLLLEGATFWGPHIGKLTHTCQREGTSHCCQTNQRKARSKSADSRRRFYGGEESTSDCASQRSNKFKLLHKIYGGGGKVHSRSASQTPTTKKTQRRSPTAPAGVQQQPEETTGHSHVLNDSGDELSSLDRAFL